MGMLEGKVAWITGAGTGIGLAGAQALAEAGA
ncbi:MAG: oxidoreductase, partial [Betaproteobacteria bacterium]|nr:oxidoreductase [Betaproteobacteria bacterium]